MSACLKFQPSNAYLILARSLLIIINNNWFKSKKSLICTLLCFSFLLDLLRWFSALLVKHFSASQKFSVILSDVVNVMIMLLSPFIENSKAAFSCGFCDSTMQSLSPYASIVGEWELFGWYFEQWQHCVSHDPEDCKENGRIYLPDVIRQGHICAHGVNTSIHMTPTCRDSIDLMSETASHEVYKPVSQSFP